MGLVLGDSTLDFRWQHLRLRTGSSEDSSIIGSAAVVNHPCRFEIYNVASEAELRGYKAQGAGAAIVVSAVLHGMACALGVSLGSLRTDSRGTSRRWWMSTNGFVAARAWLCIAE
jgi:hypothetical protein